METTTEKGKTQTSFTTAKMAEFFKLSTLQVTVFPPTFERSTKSSGTENLTRIRKGTFFFEIVPHAKESNEDNPTRLWSQAWNFALSPEEMIKLDVKLRAGDEEVTFVHNNKGADKFLKFKKTTNKKGKACFDVYITDKSKKTSDDAKDSISARLMPEELGFIIYQALPLIPYLTGVIHLVSSMKVVEADTGE